MYQYARTSFARFSFGPKETRQTFCFSLALATNFVLGHAAPKVMQLMQQYEILL
jgi:hypothetical protein